ncbi:MAG: hypothetical protein H6642_10175 [Caldilineaceae bacterium]|nr:hypothetical protein [Caldilineaceae bacterium]
MQPKPLPVTPAMRRQIAGAVAEIDLDQIEFTRQMTPAQRVRRGADLIDAAERVGVYRLRVRRPDLSEEEAFRIVRSGLFNQRKKKSE